MNKNGNIQQEKDWRYEEPLDPKRYTEYLDYARGLGLFGLLTLCGLGLFYLADKNLIGGYWTNIISTLLGAVLTIRILDKRNDYRAIRERKEELILQMGSPVNGFAVEAVRLLTLKGWLEDGSLKGQRFWNADLRGAELMRANLSGSSLMMAHLEGARLFHANLDGATLTTASLQGAFMDETSLIRADLGGAQLQGSILMLADLRGAILTNADLFGAHLQGACLDDVLWYSIHSQSFGGAATLPDGSRWTPDRDMREFTDYDEWQAEQEANQGDNAT